MARRGQDLDTDESEKKKLTRKDFKEAMKMFRFIKPYRWYLVGAFVANILLRRKSSRRINV